MYYGTRGCAMPLACGKATLPGWREPADAGGKRKSSSIAATGITGLQEVGGRRAGRRGYLVAFVTRASVYCVCMLRHNSF